MPDTIGDIVLRMARQQLAADGLADPSPPDAVETDNMVEESKRPLPPFARGDQGGSAEASRGERKQEREGDDAATSQSAHGSATAQVAHSSAARGAFSQGTIRTLPEAGDRRNREQAAFVEVDHRPIELQQDRAFETETRDRTAATSGDQP